MEHIHSFYKMVKMFFRVYFPEHMTRKYFFAGIYGSFIGGVGGGILGIATVPDNTLGLIVSVIVGAVLGFPLFLGFIEKRKDEK